MIYHVSLPNFRYDIKAEVRCLRAPDNVIEKYVDWTAYTSDKIFATGITDAPIDIYEISEMAEQSIKR